MYKEFAQTTSARTGLMVSKDTLFAILKSYKDTGYTSVYWFKEDDAKDILARRSSAGLAEYIVGSDELVIDLDNGDEQLGKTEAKLVELGLAYKVYNSGSKGSHIYIPMTEFIWSFDLPYSQRKFVESLGVEADLSLYQAGRLISNEGRIHPKTKRKKSFIKQVDGNKLHLEMVEKPKNVYQFKAIDPVGRLWLGMQACADMVSFPPQISQRHIKIYSVSKDLAAGGLSFDAVCDIMTTLNKGFPNPKTDDEVVFAVKGGFDDLKRKAVGQ